MPYGDVNEILGNNSNNINEHEAALANSTMRGGLIEWFELIKAEKQPPAGMKDLTSLYI